MTLRLWIRPITIGKALRPTPDLLIRHKESQEAYLIELKPDGYNDQEKLYQYKTIADNYIHHYEYDWLYKLITYRDIALTPEEEAVYQSLARDRDIFQRRRAQLQVDQQRHAAAVTHKRMVPFSPEDNWDQRAYAGWVKHGDKHISISNHL